MGCPISRAIAWTCSRTSLHLADGCERVHTAHTRWRAVLAEDLTQRAGPLADGAARARQGDRRGYEVLGSERRRAERVERLRHRVAVANGTPVFEVLDLFLLSPLVHDENVGLLVQRGHEWGIGRFGEAIDPDYRDITGFDLAHTLGVALHQPLLHRVDHGERAATVEYPCELGLGGLCQLGRLLLHHVRTGEQVVVLEEIGLERQHLLNPEGPLLVPGPREPERLVPRGQLDRPRPGVVRQRHAERLEHDALHVVLRLRLGEPERVHLHAEPEPAQALVGDAVTLRRDSIPQATESPVLAHLLDEADTRVHEEGDSPDDLGKIVSADLTGVAHRVEHSDRGGERIRNLFDRCRTCFLQVVRAHVDRVPPRHMTHCVTDQVDGEPA